MNKKISKIKLYIKKNENANIIAKIVKKELIDRGFELVDKDYELAISIGGDGTLLKMIHENQFNDNIYYCGINAGSLGYLTVINDDKISEFIKKLCNGKIIIKEYDVLKTNIVSNKETKEIYSFNEIVIKKLNQTVLKTNIYVDNQILEEFKGDGLLLSTTSGSTAYNLAFNGPIVDEKLNSIIITPVAPINNKLYNNINNSVVLSSNRKISMTFDKKENITILNDGKIINANSVLKIDCFIISKKIKMIDLKCNNCINKINSKII